MATQVIERSDTVHTASGALSGSLNCQTFLPRPTHCLDQHIASARESAKHKRHHEILQQTDTPPQTSPNGLEINSFQKRPKAAPKCGPATPVSRQLEELVPSIFALWVSAVHFSTGPTVCYVCCPIPLRCRMFMFCVKEADWGLRALGAYLAPWFTEWYTTCRDALERTPQEGGGVAPPPGTPLPPLLIHCSSESAERTSTQVTRRANRKKRLTVLYIVEHPNQEGDTCIDWTSQYCWTNGWNCLWRGHSVYRNRPLIPPPLLIHP